MKLKRILSAVISLSIVAANIVGTNAYSNLISAMADNIKNSDEFSGSCGEKATWSFNEETGILTIEGSGPMYQDSYISHTAWQYSTYSDKINEVVIEEGITEIGRCAFGSDNNFSSNYPNLTKVTLPSSLKKIGKNAFRYINIEKIKLPDSLEEIGQEAFWGSRLKRINLHSGITIGGFAFAECNSLNEVIIPKDLIYKIWYGNPPGANAMLSGCNSLEKVTIEGGGETIDRFGKSVFYSIPESICTECTSLKTVIIKGNVDYIGNSAFYNCPALTDIYFYNTDLSTITSKNHSNKYYIPIDTTKNPTFHVVKGSKTEQTLREAEYLTDDNTEYLTDFTALKEALSNSEKINGNTYTDKSFSALTKAIEKGKEVLNDLNATQDEVDKAAQAINDALKALKDKNTPTKPDEPSSKQPATNPTTTASNTTRSESEVNKEKSTAKNLMKQAKITKLKAKSKSKKKITVSWKKVKKAKGYQVQVSNKKSFKKVVFNKTLKKNKITVKNKKIKSKKTYYVRVRAYATYEDKYGKPQKVYSKWVKKIRKVKVK